MIIQASQGIVRAATSLALTLALILSIFFGVPTESGALVKGWTPPEEDSMPLEATGNNPLGIVSEQSGDSQNIDNESAIGEGNIGEDSDFGSDQVFPFVAGLDSY